MHIDWFTSWLGNPLLKRIRCLGCRHRLSTRNYGKYILERNKFGCNKFSHIKVYKRIPAKQVFSCAKLVTSKRATLNYSGKAVYVALMKTYSKHFWKLSKKITCGVIALVKLQSDSSEELFNTKIALSRVSPSKFSERFQNCLIPLLDCKRKYLLVEKQTFHREKQVL